MEKSDNLSIKLLNDKENQIDPITDLEYNIFVSGDKGKKN